ncbi:helicase [Oryctes borbonicus]|uniref:RNA helicase n=1 Tax=Oryctes borbonicus TaxID=1629725 RepID=A0A0T6AUJ5_9SCAR|nr:helicase [Oryctes borbonicus]
MDSKYDLMSGKCSNSKFSLKFKPTPIVFHNKNGPPSPKKIKLNNSKAEIPIPNSNSNSNFGNKCKLSIQEQKRKLPVFQNRNKLLDLIKRHQTLIILGETGCGKTTQIPQYIYSARLQNNGRIAVTQPRRVAAISIATRVSQEIGNGAGIGDTVGYLVRFEEVTSKNTKILYLTDGMLLREAIVDNLLMQYTVIILDEAHERTIHTDVLFGIVKNAQKVRDERKLTPLKVIIMSATMDVDHFSKYFECKVVYLEGRTYPVNIFYTKAPQDDYQTACVATFFKIHRQAPADEDVLIFLTGQEEIEAVVHQIRLLAKDPEVNGPPVRVYPLYASQPSSQQICVFQSVPENTRKVIVSTNVAETSITISGVKHVIDSGMVKVRSYHPTTGLDALKVQRISQEQAWQRTGRAGRVSEGNCYRIYTKFQFECLQKSTMPEIERCNLSTVVLQLLSLEIHAAHFDFMDKPPKESVASAFEQLNMLGAIEDVDSGKLTELGTQMALFPLDPRFSKILLSASNYGCLEEALTIVAILSGESIFLNPPAKRDQVQALRQKFYSAYGDHIMLLNAFREYTNVSQNNRRSWCHEHYINIRNITYAREVRAQLADICRKCQIPASSCGSNMDQVRKCLLTGLFTNVAELHRDRSYITLDKRQIVSIHPSSCIHGQKPPYILFTEVVQTSKCYLRSLTTINVEWLLEIVPDYVRIRNIKCVD